MESILIGKIVNTHGIKGEVKVYPYTDDIVHLSKLKCIYLDATLQKKYKIMSSKIWKDMLILKMENIHSIEEAQALKGIDIYIEKEDISHLEDTYYVEDLIGMNVIDENGKGIGKITYVFHTGANDVYEVKTLEQKEIYLPAIKDVIKEVDIKNKKVQIKMMEGLL